MKIYILYKDMYIYIYMYIYIFIQATSGRLTKVMQMKNLRNQSKYASLTVTTLFRTVYTLHYTYCRVLMRIPAECLSFIVFILFYSVLAAFDDHKSVFKILNTSVIKNGNSCAIVACNFLRLTDRPTAHTHTHYMHTYVIHTDVETRLTLGSGNLWAPEQLSDNQKMSKTNRLPCNPLTRQSSIGVGFENNQKIVQYRERERERQRREREREREKASMGICLGLYLLFRHQSMWKI